MPGQDGLSFLRELKRDRPEQAVIVMTAYGTIAAAVEAMQLGAFDFLQKPFSTAELLLKLERLLEFEDLATENESLRQQLASLSLGKRIVGNSEAVEALLERIRAVSRLDTTVLIQGESGTGKELVAHQIHESSHRAGGPFVPVSCAALPRELIESELFGHEPGSFTGATKRRQGRFEAAHGGTLFLDDVDDVPVEIQIKLLRVLQERTLERVGGSQPVRVNARIIAATKRDLGRMVADGEFRQDLYYRLNVVPVLIPPLRERPSDIPPLVEHFLEQFAMEMNRRPLSITAQALQKFREYSWPGNVRELEHALESMVAISDKTCFDTADIPAFAPIARPQELVSLCLEGLQTIDLAAVTSDVEDRLIRWGLAHSGGNLVKAADMLGMPRTTLQYKVRKMSDVPQTGAP